MHKQNNTVTQHSKICEAIFYINKKVKGRWLLPSGWLLFPHWKEPLPMVYDPLIAIIFIRFWIGKNLLFFFPRRVHSPSRNGSWKLCIANKFAIFLRFFFIWWIAFPSHKLGWPALQRTLFCAFQLASCGKAKKKINQTFLFEPGSPQGGLPELQKVHHY